MQKADKLAAMVIKTLVTTYPEDDPRARVRKFNPLFMWVGFIIGLVLVVSGVAFIFSFDGIIAKLVLMVYSLMIFPSLMWITWMISTKLNAGAVALLKLKDRIFRRQTRDQSMTS